MNDELRRRLVLGRRLRGMSQRAAAQAGEVSNTTWGRLESGEIGLTPVTVLAVARAFNWPEDWPESPPDEKVSEPDVALREAVDVLTDRIDELVRLVARLTADPPNGR